MVAMCVFFFRMALPCQWLPTPMTPLPHLSFTKTAGAPADHVHWRQSACWRDRDVKHRSGVAVTSSIVLAWPWRQASFWRVVTMTPAHVIVVAAHRQQLLAALSCITIAQPQQLHGLFMTSQNMSESDQCLDLWWQACNKLWFWMGVKMDKSKFQ